MTRYQPSTRNTRTERDGYGFALVALIGVVLMVALTAVLLVSLYSKASHAIQDVTDCATHSGVGVPCPDGSTR